MTASIRQMEKLLSPEENWDTHESAQTNAKFLNEAVDTFSRAVQTLCPDEDTVEHINEALYALKPYFLLFRGNHFYGANMATEAAIVRAEMRKSLKR